MQAKSGSSFNIEANSYYIEPWWPVEDSQRLSVFTNMPFTFDTKILDLPSLTFRSHIMCV